MTALTVRKIGNSIGFTVPKAKEADYLGKTAIVVETGSGDCTITPHNN